ncbi:unnamed protein product [Coregonus sp. 'balchen']|nr:unnamed protein product [Coregonus sp. 'balchen']
MALAVPGGVPELTGVPGMDCDSISFLALFNASFSRLTFLGTMQTMTQNTLPPGYPDLNPIKLVWHQLKTFIHNSAKPTSKDELVKAIKTFWLEKLTIQQCNKYMDHLSKVLPVVVELGGSASKI